MTACQTCPGDLSPRLETPISLRTRLRRLADELIAPPIRLHQYRNLATGMLEDAMDKMDGSQCK